MDDYDSLKKSRLKLKGEKRKKKAKHHSGSNKPSSSETGPDSKVLNERSEDAEEHGGWWKVEQFEHIKDDVAIEFLGGCYARAMRNGAIVLGNPHPPGEGPDEEEIFTAVLASHNQIALKSGFGRYLSIDSKKHLVGLSEAIGEPENFLPVFEDGKLALCAFNECFLGPDIDAEESDQDVESQPIVAKSSKVTQYQILSIRVMNDYSSMSRDKEKEGPSDDLGTLYEAELNYLKKYQSHGEKNFNLKDDKKSLKKARLDGQLHEALLDKREKVKSDKYCK